MYAGNKQINLVGAQSFVNDKGHMIFATVVLAKFSLFLNSWYIDTSDACGPYIGRQAHGHKRFLGWDLRDFEGKPLKKA